MEFVLIVILIVIVSVLSAAAKKKPGSSGSRYAPPETRMSDIQRAFMMANAPERRPAPQPTLAPFQASPDMPLTPVSAGTDASSEGRISSEAAAPTMAESYTGLSEDELVKPMGVESVVPLADIRPDVHFTDEEKPATSVPKSSAPKMARIPLFNDQQEIVRAFIYAEILPCRAYPRRFQ